MTRRLSIQIQTTGSSSLSLIIQRLQQLPHLPKIQHQAILPIHIHIRALLCYIKIKRESEIKKRDSQKFNKMRVQHWIQTQDPYSPPLSLSVDERVREMLLKRLERKRQRVAEKVHTKHTLSLSRWEGRERWSVSTFVESKTNWKIDRSRKYEERKWGNQIFRDFPPST